MRRASRVDLLADISGSPASAMTACFRVDLTHPVTILAVALSSREDLHVGPGRRREPRRSRMFHGPAHIAGRYRAELLVTEPTASLGEFVAAGPASDALCCAADDSEVQIATGDPASPRVG